jgi:hypothetical protein
MVKKENPPAVTPVSDPKLKRALEDTSDIFKSRSEDYNQISSDIKATEEFLRNKGLKDVFTCDFDRKNLQVMPNEHSNEDHGTYHREGLDWRFDHKSKKFRLMVTNYEVHYSPTDDADPIDPDPALNPGHWVILETRPLMEYPIQARTFYHPKLEKFIRLFAGRFKKYKDNGDIYRGEICLAFYGDGKEEYENHTELCRTSRSHDHILDERVIIETFKPGGICDMPPEIRRIPATKKEIENKLEWKEAFKERDQHLKKFQKAFDTLLEDTSKPLEKILSKEMEGFVKTNNKIKKKDDKK